jgi:hypothetical protein
MKYSSSRFFRGARFSNQRGAVWDNSRSRIPLPGRTDSPTGTARFGVGTVFVHCATQAKCVRRSRSQFGRRACQCTWMRAGGRSYSTCSRATTMRLQRATIEVIFSGPVHEDVTVVERPLGRILPLSDGRERPFSAAGTRVGFWQPAGPPAPPRGATSGDHANRGQCDGLDGGWPDSH